MNLEYVQFTLGPLSNNVYLLGDQVDGSAVVIDPSYESADVLARAETLGWRITQVWLTHAHFDHIAGAGEISNAFESPLPVGLHGEDLGWYKEEGGAGKFGMSIPALPDLSLSFEDGMQLSLSPTGEIVVNVMHAPGHSPGHVMFYCEPLGVLFCGDIIFREGIGRTDLAGGGHQTLLESIRRLVLTLPDETRLLPGHGPESTVGHERENNPFIK